ncbi:hypothetical protein NUM3379_10360 [Kineococcus sp. NUM-3379]
MRSAARREEGSAALELAFVAPALLLLVFTTIQVGLWYSGRSVALQAAREGVSQLRLAGTEAQAAALEPFVTERVLRFSQTVGRESLLAPAATVRWFVVPEDGGNARVEVVVTGRVVSLVPGLDLRTTQRAQGEVERFEGAVP